MNQALATAPSTCLSNLRLRAIFRGSGAIPTVTRHKTTKPASIPASRSICRRGLGTGGFKLRAARMIRGNWGMPSRYGTVDVMSSPEEGIRIDSCRARASPSTAKESDQKRRNGSR